MALIRKFNGDILQWMRGFYHVATSGSLTAAAKEMRINRAGIRHHLRRLEEELNVTLFERGRDRLQITPEGLRLLEWCKTVFETMENLVGDMSHSSENIKGSIRLATQHHIAINILKRPIAEFLEQYPNTDIHIQSGVLGQIQQWMDARESEIGICARPENSAPYNFTPLYTTRLCLVAPKGKFQIPPEPALEDLAWLPFIQFTAGSPSPRLEEALQEKGYQPKKKITVDSDLVALEYVRAGIGVAVLRNQHYEMDSAGLEMYNLSFVPSLTPIGLLTLKTAYISPASLVFMEYCQKYFGENAVF